MWRKASYAGYAKLYVRCAVMHKIMLVHKCIVQATYIQSSWLNTNASIITTTILCPFREQPAECVPDMIRHIHLHLASSCPLAHKALIQRCQLLRFCACILAWLHDVCPSCSPSFSTVLLHVVFGLPTLRVSSCVRVRAVTQ